MRTTRRFPMRQIFPVLFVNEHLVKGERNVLFLERLGRGHGLDDLPFERLERLRLPFVVVFEENPFGLQLPAPTVGVRLIAGEDHTALGATPRSATAVGNELP